MILDIQYCAVHVFMNTITPKCIKMLVTFGEYSSTLDCFDDREETLKVPLLSNCRNI